MTTYQIIYWRNIPAQVKVRAGREKLSRPLSDRFQEAIDEAAMRAKTTGTDDYLEEWRTSEWHEREGEAAAVAGAVLAELEAAYPDERLRRLVRNNGEEGYT
jgi:hypothetical protein